MVIVSPAILVFLWMLSLSLKNEIDNIAYPPVFIPDPPTLANFANGEMDVVRTGESRMTEDEIYGALLDALADEARHVLRRVDLPQFLDPDAPGLRIAAFVERYNHARYHESLDNLTPADVYFGRGQTILLQRERIKRKTIEQRRLLHRKAAA